MRWLRQTHPGSSNSISICEIAIMNRTKTKRKAIYAVGMAVLSVSLFFVWCVTRRFERRVVPNVVGMVVDFRGEPIEITESDITVLNDTIGSVDVDISGTGKFSVSPRIAMLRSRFGYSLTDTLISVGPKGYKIASVRVRVANDELLLDRPAIEFTITFRLRTESEEGESSTEVTSVDPLLLSRFPPES